MQAMFSGDGEVYAYYMALKYFLGWDPTILVAAGNDSGPAGLGVVDAIWGSPMSNAGL